MKAGGPLGLSIIGGSDHSCVPFGTGEPGIFISKVHDETQCGRRLLVVLKLFFQIIPGGAAANTKRLRMGDRILSVNSIDIRSASHQDAVLALLSKTDRMNITVQHDPLPSGFQVIDRLLYLLCGEQKMSNA